ncbi:MAG: ATP-binding protein [Clostridiales bacterium]|nr:ATP-binding protein [Clostridiales bacterium]
MPDVLKFSIPGKPEYVQMVRLAIASIAGTANFDVDAVEDIKVAVAEACKTVSCHGFDGFSNTYEIICEIDENSMLITVADAQSGHDLVKANRPCSNCPNEGDMALAVMESLMDKVEVIAGKVGNESVKMVKNK